MKFMKIFHLVERREMRRRDVCVTRRAMRRISSQAADALLTLEKSSLSLVCISLSVL